MSQVMLMPFEAGGEIEIENDGWLDSFLIRVTHFAPEDADEREDGSAVVFLTSGEAVKVAMQLLLMAIALSDTRADYQPTTTDELLAAIDRTI